MKEHSIPVSHIVPHRFFAPYKVCYGSNLDNDWAQNLVKPELELEEEKIKIELLKQQITLLERLIKFYVQLLNYWKGRQEK